MAGKTRIGIVQYTFPPINIGSRWIHYGTGNVNPFAPCSADLHYIFIQPRGLLPCEELGQFFCWEAVLQRYTSNFNVYFFEIFPLKKVLAPQS